MGNMNISIDGMDNILKEIRGLEAKGEKVIQRSVSDLKSRAPSWISQEIVKKYNIKKKDIKEKASIKAVGRGLDGVSIVYSGKPITLDYFNKKLGMEQPFSGEYGRMKIGNEYKMVRLRTPIVAKVTIIKGERKPIGSLTDDKVHPIFTAKTKYTNGNYLPFQRTGGTYKTGTDKFKSLATVSVPQMIENEEVKEKIKERINEEMPKRIEHHIKQVMGK